MSKDTGIRMLFTGVDSVDGYQKRVLERIDSQLSFEKCVLVQKVHDDLDVFDSQKYRLINYDVCAHCRYQEFYDFNDMKPLSRELIRAMAPYENTAMHMLQRRYNFDVYYYDEQRRIYLQHLQFWNDLFEKEQINYVVLSNVPHHTYDYIIYALAKMRNIKICIFEITVINERYFPCNDLENSVISVDYREDEEDIKLADDIELYYQVKTLDTSVDGTRVERREADMRLQREVFYTDVRKKKVYRRYLAKMKQGLKAIVKNQGTEIWKKNWAEIKENYEYVTRAHRKIRKMIPIEEYDKMAEEPDYTKPYVVYFLQLQPEATTLPMGGEFVDQILAVKILAETLEKVGIKLYVKEHFVQPCREIYFYRDIQKIRGVTLIKSTVNSKEMIRHCLAVSTCTGTVILESIINGKPALVFGNSMLNSAPGVYRISDTDECKSAVDEIRDKNFEISSRYVRQFLKAFGEQTMEMYIYLERESMNDTLTVQQSADNFAKVVVEWYQQESERV